MRALTFNYIYISFWNGQQTYGQGNNLHILHAASKTCSEYLLLLVDLL